MNTSRTPLGLALVALAWGWAQPAAATASMGGVVSLVGGSGLCNVSESVPLNTLQDSFSLSRSTACAGTHADAQLRGSAATGSVGLRAASSGNGLGSSQVAAQVYLTDQWQINVPAGTPFGALSLPVSLHLEGSISPAALRAYAPGSFLAYTMNIGVPFSFSVLSANGAISTTGAFAQTFSGHVVWQYSGQPLRAAIELNLTLYDLNEGVVDFYNSAAASIQLPAGYSATTSSGVALVLSPVPEPAPAALLLAGLALVLLAPRLRNSRATKVRPG